MDSNDSRVSMAERTSTKRDRAWLRRSDSFRGNCDLMFFWIWLCRRSTLTNALVNSRLHTRLNVWQTWGRYEYPLPQYWRQWIREQVKYFDLILFHLKENVGTTHEMMSKKKQTLPSSIWGEVVGEVLAWNLKVCSFRFYILACDTYSIWCDNEHSLFCLLMINTRSNLVQPELPVSSTCFRTQSTDCLQSHTKHLVSACSWYWWLYFWPVHGEHLPVKTQHICWSSKRLWTNVIFETQKCVSATS